MIIDCHGHFTTTPAEHQEFRDAQLAWLDRRDTAAPAPPVIGDDAIRESIEQNQLRLLRERGGGVDPPRRFADVGDVHLGNLLKATTSLVLTIGRSEERGNDLPGNRRAAICSPRW